MKLNPKQFYFIGVISMSIISLANIVNFILSFKLTNFWTKVASLAGIVFNLALAGLFRYLISLEPKEEILSKSDDIDEIIKELENG